MAQFFMLANKLARLKDTKERAEEARKITRTILARTIAGPAYPASYNWDAADRVLAIFDIPDIPRHHPSPGPRIGRSEVGQSPRASTATEGVDRVAGKNLSSIDRCPNCKSADILPHIQDMKICVACNHRWYPAAISLGKIKSPKKAAASRKNGKLGGRPRKNPARRGGPDV